MDPQQLRPRGYSLAPTQPFLQDARRNVNALNNMATALESELRSLFVYYGESTETAEGMKAEDFFRMILSFATSLQVSTNRAVTPDPRLTL